LWIDLFNFDRNSMVLYMGLHSMPRFLCKHGLSQAFCKNLWSWFATIEIYENLYALWAAMVSMINYILWLEKQVFLMYLNQRFSLIVPCTSLLSILQPNSQAVVGWVYCYLPASTRQLEHCSTPLSNKSITFSQLWIFSPNLSTVPCPV
jgi:hypothetical protein